MSSSILLDDESAQKSGRRGRAWHITSAWLPVLLCILAISQESTIAFGADHTSQPLQHFFEFFFGPFTRSQWWRWHFIIRKCGHFLGYGILSLSWFRAFWMSTRLVEPLHRRRAWAHAMAMVGTLLVASADEFHQTFLPNRTGTPVDVLIDCSGAALLQVLAWLWMRRRVRSGL
jgi:VanZ family protein